MSESNYWKTRKRVKRQISRAKADDRLLNCFALAFWIVCGAAIYFGAAAMFG